MNSSRLQTFAMALLAFVVALCAAAAVMAHKRNAHLSPANYPLCTAKNISCAARLARTRASRV